MLLQTRTESREQLYQATWCHFLRGVSLPSLYSSSLFCSMKNAVACEHDPVFHKGCSASPKHNDSSDLARSSTKKFQIHIALPFTAIFTLPSLHMCSSLCPSFQQRSQVDQCWAAAASSVFLDFPPSENIKPRLFHRDNSLVKAWPLLVVRASSHQGQHQLFAT